MNLYLSLGSNIGNRKQNLENAIDLLSEAFGRSTVSKLYCTAPWGELNQPEFLNMTVKYQTALELTEIHALILDIEAQLKKEKAGHWLSRNIDIDILLYGSQVINSEILTVPHARLHERNFVLVPLAEIAPNAVHPLFNVTIMELLKVSKDESVVGVCEN